MFKRVGEIIIGKMKYDVYKKEGDRKPMIKITDLVDSIGYNRGNTVSILRCIDREDWDKGRTIVGNNKHITAKFVTIKGLYNIVSLSRSDEAKEMRNTFF